MLQEVASYLVSLGSKAKPIEQLDFAGRKYTDREIKPVKSPLVTALNISTLRSLCDLLTAKFGESAFEKFAITEHVVHVVGPELVQVVAAGSNEWAEREVIVSCKAIELKGFPFAQFIGQEQFVTNLLALFTPDGDRDNVLKWVGNATAGTVTTSLDDGVSQSISLRVGAALKDQQEVKRIVSLAPYRTFPEVAQPISEFVLRVRQEGETNMPKFALFEADGGKWEIAARENVGRFLRAGLPTGTVVVS